MSVDLITFAFPFLLILFGITGCVSPAIPPVVEVVNVKDHNITIDSVSDNNDTAIAAITKPELNKSVIISKAVVKKVPSKVLVKEAVQAKEIKEKKTETIQFSVNETLSKSASSVVTLKEVGPKGWTVGDIAKKVKYQKLSEKVILKYILSVKAPYKKFSYDEIQTMIGWGLSYKIINTMMMVSK